MTRNIYLISAEIGEEKYYKIGITKRTVEQRIKDLKTGNPAQFNVEKVYETDNYANSIEKRLHHTFSSKKIDGEWFLLDIEDIEKFEELCDQYYETFNMLQQNNLYIKERDIKFK